MKTIASRRHLVLMQKLGTAAFLFFLVKGLLWLAAPFFFLWIV